jgi:glycosyltransferase involved in cell wall biosynthesis
LAEAVERLLSENALREKLVKNGRQTLHDRFQWETLVGQTEKALIRLSPEGKSRG